MIGLRIAVFGVAYPGVEPFLDDYFEAWANQTDPDFVLCLLNDGVSDLKERADAHELQTRIMNARGTPSELRHYGIRWCREQHMDAMVFSDTDDKFMPNRVALAKDRLSGGIDIMVNDIIPFGSDFPEETRWLSSRLANEQSIGIDLIQNGNCLGLSNTAMHMSVLDNCTIAIPAGIAAFDWAFFSTLLEFGKRAEFTSETITYYRQHPDNIAGVQKIDDNAVLRGVRIKTAHYRYMASLFPGYQPLQNAFRELEAQLSDPAFKTRYVKAARQAARPGQFWWEQIRTIEELGL